MGGQHNAPAALPPGKTRYPLYRRLGGPQGRSGQMRKISPPPGFDPRTVQPVASRYTDWATRPLFFFRRYKIWNIFKWWFTTKRNSEATGRYRMWTSPVSSFIALRLVQTGQGPSNVKTAGPCCILEHGEPRECITKHTILLKPRDIFMHMSSVLYFHTAHARISKRIPSLQPQAHE
jgi:hypothetical protein